MLHVILSPILATNSKHLEPRTPCFKWELDNEIIKCAKSAKADTFRKK